MNRHTILTRATLVATVLLTLVLLPRLTVRAQSTRTLNVATPILLTSGNVVDLTGTKLVWTGPAGGSMFTNDPSQPVMRCGVRGGLIDPGSAGYGFNLHSPQNCQFDTEFLGGTPTFTAMRIAADAQNATGYENTRNAVFNRVSLVTGQVGTLLELAGAADGNGYVTLNDFQHLWTVGPGGVQRQGIVIRQPGWVDTNEFGNVRLTMGGQNAVGIDLGDSGLPQGVYDNYFRFVSIDAWIAGANQTGISYHGLSQARNPVLGPSSPYNGAGMATAVRP